MYYCVRRFASIFTIMLKQTAPFSHLDAERSPWMLFIKEHDGEAISDVCIQTHVNMLMCRKVCGKLAYSADSLYGVYRTYTGSFLKFSKARNNLLFKRNECWDSRILHWLKSHSIICFLIFPQFFAIILNPMFIYNIILETSSFHTMESVFESLHSPYSDDGTIKFLASRSCFTGNLNTDFVHYNNDFMSQVCYTNVILNK